MPVRKYRSVEDMPQAALRTPLDPHNLELACELSRVAARLAPRRFPPGTPLPLGGRRQGTARVVGTFGHPPSPVNI